MIDTRTFQQVVYWKPLYSKRLFIDASWKVLVDTLITWNLVEHNQPQKEDCTLLTGEVTSLP